MRNDGWPINFSPDHHAGKIPCRDCTSRSIGCHDKCEKYQEHKRKADLIKADVRRQRIPLDIEAHRVAEIALRAIKRR